MLFKPSKNLTLIVYEDAQNTKCFQFPKTQLKIALYLIPLIVMLSLGLSVLVLTVRIGKHQIPIPSLKSDGGKYQEKILGLEGQLEELKTVNKGLLSKINSPVTATGSAHSAGVGLGDWPQLIGPIQGLKDLSVDSPIKLDSFTAKSLDRGGVQLNFNINHTLTGESKTSGHILVLLKVGNTFEFYPKSNDNIDSALSTFNLGETFTVHRFRPVEALFPQTNVRGKQGLFKILIFNRTGDLLQKHTLGPVNL